MQEEQEFKNRERELDREELRKARTVAGYRAEKTNKKRGGSVEADREIKKMSRATWQSRRNSETGTGTKEE